MGAQTRTHSQPNSLGLLGEHVTHSLEFYRAVEETTQNLTAVERGARQLVQDVQDQLDHVRANPESVTFSNDGEGEQLIEEAESFLKDFVGTLQGKLDSAYADPGLHGPNQDMVTTSYEQAIRVLSDVHNLLVDLRWEVMECEANRSETVGPFETWDEFWNALKEGE